VHDHEKMAQFSEKASNRGQNLHLYGLLSPRVRFPFRIGVSFATYWNCYGNHMYYDGKFLLLTHSDQTIDGYLRGCLLA
jgi:hypothetical protein